MPDTPEDLWYYWDMHEIYLWFSWYRPGIYQIFIWDLPEIYQIYAWDICEKCLSYAYDMCEMYMIYHLTWIIDKMFVSCEWVNKWVSSRFGARDAYTSEKIFKKKLLKFWYWWCYSYSYHNKTLHYKLRFITICIEKWYLENHLSYLWAWIWWPSSFTRVISEISWYSQIYPSWAWIWHHHHLQE